MFLGSLCVTACAQVPSQSAATAAHVVAIRPDGTPYATPPLQDLDDAAPVDARSAVLTALRDHVVRTRSKRVLIFIHGGLNSPADTTRRALELTPRIERAGYFPIFINWHSSLISSYGEHLTSVRQGQRWQPALAWGTLPAVLATDGFRALARAPLVWVLQIGNAVEDFGEWLVDGRWRDNERRVVTQQSVVLDPGRDGRRSRERTVASALRILSFPSQLLSAGVVDAVGKSAWDIMLRRTELMFHLDTRAPERAGALAQFLTGLAEMLDPSWEVVLVGHSMGTIVANGMLREFGSIDFDRIVYMAAACSVADYEDSVFPYLEAHPETRMYHLTLHHKSEVRETVFAPVLQGSLLVWIDDFLSTPLTPRDRTAGRYVNLIVAAEQTPRELADRIHIKEFDAGAEMQATDPQGHGSFTDCRFWELDFADPGKRPDACTLEPGEAVGAR